MKFATALAAFALALAGVEATKHGMHGGGLTLQELLALRNGIVLPESESFSLVVDCLTMSTRHRH